MSFIFKIKKINYSYLKNEFEFIYVFSNVYKLRLQPDILANIKLNTMCLSYSTYFFLIINFCNL